MAAEECLSNQKMVEKPTMESRTRATMRTVSEIGFRSSPAFCWWPHIKNTRGPWTAMPALMKVEERWQNQPHAIFWEKAQLVPSVV